MTVYKSEKQNIVLVDGWTEQFFSHRYSSCITRIRRRTELLNVTKNHYKPSWTENRWKPHFVLDQRDAVRL